MKATQKKIVIVGAGSMRTLVLVHDAIELAKKYGSVQMVLVDTNQAKAEAMERLCRLMPEFDPSAMELAATTNFDCAADGADLVQVVIRVNGAAEGRDQGICTAHDIHGDDTYGPSAITLGLRTIPHLLKMARSMEKRCPAAWLCVFSNPVTMNTDVLNRYTKIKTLGICGGVENFVSDFRHLHYDPEQPIEGLKWRGAGLNHFSWVTKNSTFRGEPIGDYLRRHIKTLDETKLTPFLLWHLEKPVFDFTGQMPMNNGHFYHYFLWDNVMAGRKKPRAKSRRPRVEDPWKRRFALSKQSSIDAYWQTFVGRTDDYFDRIDPAVKAMFSMWYDLGWDVGLNVPNHGHVVDLPDGHVVETTCRVTAKGPQPLAIDAVPPVIKSLTQAVTYQQRMVADLMVNPSLKALTEAVFADPCHRSLGRVQAVAQALWTEYEKDRSAK